jgi:hypothetical protein
MGYESWSNRGCFILVLSLVVGLMYLLLLLLLLRRQLVSLSRSVSLCFALSRSTVRLDCDARNRIGLRSPGQSPYRRFDGSFVDCCSAMIDDDDR